MNTRTIVVSLMSGLVLGLVGLALAGTEPSPFDFLINELDSVENVLDVADDQLNEFLQPPPDDSKPNALVGKLNAMEGKLWNQNDRVVDVIEAVPPEPCQEFYDALVKVGYEASSIAERAHPPDPCTPEVEEALAGVGSAAQAIVEAVRGAMPLPS